MTSNMPPIHSDNGPTHIGLLFSGGLDSGILLHRFLKQGYRVQPLYVRSDCFWEREERPAAERFLQAVRSPHLDELVTLHVPLSDLYEDHWSMTGRQVPDADTPASAVCLPGRNALLVTKAALWCQLHGIESLALAALRENPFADATDSFFEHIESALNQSEGRELVKKLGQAPRGKANCRERHGLGSEPVPFFHKLRPIRLIRPFSELSKRQVLELGDGCPLELTFSCLAPVAAVHCGRCNKCAERLEAFTSVGRNDPTEYHACTPCVKETSV